jgi:hypothetical protein
MNAIDDDTLSHETVRGLIIFLFSEYKRHSDDMDMIRKMIEKLRVREHFTEMEMDELEYVAEKYREF